MKHLFFYTITSAIIFFLLSSFSSSVAVYASGTPLCGENAIDSAIGCIPVGDSKAFTIYLLKWLSGIAGGIALVLIVYSGLLVMTSSGDPKKVQAGKELFTATVSGLVFLVSCAFILSFIGQDLLGILK